MRRIIRFICRSIWNYCFGDFLHIYYDKEGKKRIDIAEEEKEAGK